MSPLTSILKPRFVAGLLLAGGVIAGQVACAQPHSQARQPAASCPILSDYDTIMATVTEQFYDQNFNGLDWHDEVAQLRDTLSCDMSVPALSEAINTQLARLDASHTALYSRHDLDYWGLNSLFTPDTLAAYELAFPGIWPTQQQVDGESVWFASYVLESSAAANAGVRAGDELISINGEAFTPTGFVPGENTLTLASTRGSAREITLDVPRQSVMRAFVDASRRSSRLLSVADKQVFYYHIWGARDAILQDFNEKLQAYAQQGMDALIIDLRGGFGGTSEDYLTQVRELTASRNLSVYWLIDDSVRSGKELLAGVVRRDGLGTLVGSTTAGYYLAGRMNRLLDDRYFLYVAVDTYPTPDAGVIEGVGVAPDVAVSPCRQWCAMPDPQLGRALELVRL